MTTLYDDILGPKLTDCSGRLLHLSERLDVTARERSRLM
jgi:hypothetical protein